MGKQPLIQVIIIVIAVLFFAAPMAEAQSGPGPAKTETPYLLPQTIFVGDSGRLVVPLGQAFSGTEPFVLDTPGSLPGTPQLVIRRIELERRNTGSRLLIDFIPYAPGVLAFPPLELSPPGSKPFSITGLEAQVASILNPSQTTLSEPAPPMAVPGTSFLVYGSIVIILVLLFAGTGGSIWGRRHFRELWERLRKRRLLRAMANFLRRMEQEGDIGKNGDSGFYLTLLSGEFREFLSLFTGVNCRSLTPEEFLDLPLEYSSGEEAGSAAASPAGFSRPDRALLTPAFLCGLFRNWDTLRFSGRGVDKIDLFQAIKAAENFIVVLDKTEREKPLSKPVRESRVPEKIIEEAAGGVE